MDKTQQELFLGKKMTVKTIPGREGKVIGQLPDGRVILFDLSNPYSKILAPGQSVECNVTYIHEKYIIVNPIHEPNAIDAAAPIPRVEVDKIVEDLANLVGEAAEADSDKIIEDLEKMIGRVSKNAKVIPKALIHVIRLERLMIKILTDYVITRSKA
jgi:hypothetical protein